jgi:hypothetical protein
MRLNAENRLDDELITLLSYISTSQKALRLHYRDYFVNAV